jgi:hypothetical protein
MDSYISILLILSFLLVLIIFLNTQININIIVPNFENKYTTFYNSNIQLKIGINSVRLNKGGYLHIYIKDTDGKMVNDYYYGNNSKENKNWTSNNLKNGYIINLPSKFVNIFTDPKTTIIV